MLTVDDSQALASTNAALRASGATDTMRQFAMESERMGVTQEMLDDAFSMAFEDDDEEVDDVLGPILGEVGLELSAKMVRCR